MKDAIDILIRRKQAEYLDSLLSERDELLAEMERHAAENNQPIADPEVAQLIRLLVRLRAPKRIVEVGTNIGYSVVVMGRECPANAMIETIELDRRILDVARQFVNRAALGCEVVYHEGAALDVLSKLVPGVDLAFIDCVKSEYPAYLELLLPRMSEGGVIVADNVLWKGQVAEGVRDEATNGIREFNRMLTSDPRLLTTVLPIGDGVSISIVK